MNITKDILDREIYNFWLENRKPNCKADDCQKRIFEILSKTNIERSSLLEIEDLFNEYYELSLKEGYDAGRHISSLLIK